MKHCAKEYQTRRKYFLTPSRWHGLIALVNKVTDIKPATQKANNNLCKKTSPCMRECTTLKYNACVTQSGPTCKLLLSFQNSLTIHVYIQIISHQNFLRYVYTCGIIKIE